MAKFRAGKTGRVSVDSQVLALASWTTKYSGDKLDTGNFESNGYKTQLTGFVGVDWTIDGNWDASDNPLDDPPGLYPRDDGVNMILYTSTVDNVFWTFDDFYVGDADIKNTATGLVTFSASGSSQGTFSTPTGSV